MRKSHPTAPVTRITILVQDAYDPARAEAVENYSFSPARALAAHRSLGGINRAFLVVYTTMASLRRRQNGQPKVEPKGDLAAPAV